MCVRLRCVCVFSALALCAQDCERFADGVKVLDGVGHRAVLASQETIDWVVEEATITTAHANA